MIRFLLTVLLVCACAPSESEPQSPESRSRTATRVDTDAPAPSPKPGATKPDSKPQERNVRLTSPREGDVIRTNPIMVRGEARTFENNVVIRVLEARGFMMTETFTTARGEMGTFSPFEKEIFLTRDPGRQITVQAFEYSAKDGSVQHMDTVTVPADLRLIKVTLYVPKESPTDCTVVQPKEVEIPVSDAMARLLVEALLNDPIFPKGSAVNSVNLRSGVVTVDFNERLSNVGGSCRAQAIRAAVETTLKQLSSVKRVRITTLGDEKTALQP